MPSISNPPSLRAKVVYAVLCTVAAGVLFIVQANRTRNGYLYASGSVEAYIGVFGAMAFASGMVGIFALGLLAFRRIRPGIICLACAIGLIGAAQYGRVPCAPVAGLAGYQCVVPGTSIWKGKSMGRGHISREVQYERMTVVMQILFGLGGATTIWAIFLCRQARRSQDWPMVPGLVTHAKVNRRAAPSGEPAWMARWNWHVCFLYSVDGQAYQGTRVYLGMDVPIGVARNIVAKFPAGSAVNVYYNPAHHGRALLISGMNKYTWFAFLPGLFFGILAVGFWHVR
ncbi:DUF3592 domain-containing protein [Massilia sp. S19_KUP03_FR1]|uniref:DUF3592 domain-containing protein n=1 Tax=Massilia sp. S19_KUP03_FR1 TaxID=3025503 RepID=UPI002FCD938A